MSGTLHTADLRTTKRAEGQPERRHPLMGKQALPVHGLRHQQKAVPRHLRAKAAHQANHRFERQSGLMLRPPGDASTHAT